MNSEVRHGAAHRRQIDDVIRRPASQHPRPTPLLSSSPSNNTSRHPFFGKPFWVSFFVVIVLLNGCFLLFHLFSPQNPLPAQWVKTTSFTLFYPAKLPDGFAYKQGSATLQQGVLFFKLVRNDQYVLISEQARPTTDPNVSNMEGFNPLSLSIGRAYAGKANGAATIIVFADKTLLILNGSAGLPDSIVQSVAKKLVVAR